MKKKMLALICVMSMSMMAVACGNTEEAATTDDTVAETTVEDTETPAAAEETTEETEEVAEDVAIEDLMGEVDGNTYKSEYFGYAIDVDSDWTIYTAEQINATMDTATDLAGEDFEELLESSGTVTDFMATAANGTDTVNCNFAEMNALQQVIDEETLATASISMLEEQLGNMGCEDITTEVTTVNFAGQDHAAIHVEATYSGVSLYETVVIVTNGQYYSGVTACTWQEDTTADILDSFYAL